MISQISYSWLSFVTSTACSNISGSSGAGIIEGLSARVADWLSDFWHITAAVAGCGMLIMLVSSLGLPSIGLLCASLLLLSWPQATLVVVRQRCTRQDNSDRIGRPKDENLKLRKKEREVRASGSYL
jgi:ABC-type dipeptide/oligopeptide/nickel transport system permease subunit